MIAIERLTIEKPKMNRMHVMKCESESDFSSIANQLEAGIVQTDLAGRFILVNQGYCDIVGYTQAELAGMRMQDLLHRDDLPRHAELFERLTAGGKKFAIETRCVRKDGSVVWVHSRLSLSRAEAGKERTALAVILDVSARKQMEEDRGDILAREREAREEAETLNEVSRTLAGELDLQKLVQRVTDAGTKLTGARFGAFFYNAINQEGETYVLYTLSGAPREAFEKFGLPRNTQMFGPTFAGTGVVRSEDVLKDPRYGHNAPHYGMPKGHLPVRSYLAVPVVSRSGVVLGGMFFAHPTPGVFTERSERLGLALAAQAAIAIDNGRLYERAQQEIAARAKAEAMQTGHMRVLQMIAHGAPLDDILQELVRIIEGQFHPELLASILLLEGDGVHLKHCAAPSLPDSYNRAIDGLAIGLKAGSCGTAAYTKRPVYVSDIATDPVWAGWKDLALAHELRACWSAPILSGQGEVLGTFAMYYRVPRAPSQEHIKAIEVATRTAAIAIERARAELSLRESERRFREMFDALPAAIYTTDAAGRLTYYNPAAVEFSGRVPDLGSDQWCVSWKLYRPDGTLLPHDECPMAVSLKEGRTIRGAEAIAERPDGKRIWFTPYPTPVRDAAGNIAGGVNMLVDITDRKRAEEALKDSHEELRRHLDELQRFNRVAVERELRIIEIKKEVNELCRQQGQSLRYPLEFEQTHDQLLTFREKGQDHESIR